MKHNQLKELIKNSKKILLLAHINPDGDALGSLSALYTAIYDNFKKKSDIIITGHFPSSYKFLPNLTDAKKEFEPSLVYDLVITVDVASEDRLADSKILFDKAKTKVNIDHHKTNTGFGNLNFIEPNASSAGEVLLGIFNELELNISLDCATALYVAILTDTGGFKYENTSSNVFKSAAQLVEIGINPNKLYKACYESKTKDFVMFQNYCINKSEFLYDNKVAYSTVYKKDLEKFNAQDDFTEGLVETLREIVTTDISFLAKEIDNKTTKMSMRSKKTDVAKICLAFGGGGHTHAAGCTIKSNMDNAIKKLLKVIEENIDG